MSNGLRFPQSKPRRTRCGFEFTAAWHDAGRGLGACLRVPAADAADSGRGTRAVEDVQGRRAVYARVHGAGHGRASAGRSSQLGAVAGLRAVLEAWPADPDPSSSAPQRRGIPRPSDVDLPAADRPFRTLLEAFDRRRATAAWARGPRCTHAQLFSSSRSEAHCALIRTNTFRSRTRTMEGLSSATRRDRRGGTPRLLDVSERTTAAAPRLPREPALATRCRRRGTPRSSSTGTSTRAGGRAAAALSGQARGRPRRAGRRGASRRRSARACAGSRHGRLDATMSRACR